MVVIIRKRKWLPQGIYNGYYKGAISDLNVIVIISKYCCIKYSKLITANVRNALYDCFQSLDSRNSAVYQGPLFIHWYEGESATCLFLVHNMQ